MKYKIAVCETGSST